MQSDRSKAAIYVRVSTADQHVESQLYDLRELAAQRGLHVVQEYRDSGVSGKRARRPGLDVFIADARQKRFSVVLVAAFDRVARSVKHFLQLMDEFDSLGVVFVSRRENVDTSGAMGRLFLTLIGPPNTHANAVQLIAMELMVCVSLRPQKGHFYGCRAVLTDSCKQFPGHKKMGAQDVCST
jgi:Resolvase, N terminal domain